MLIARGKDGGKKALKKPHVALLRLVYSVPCVDELRGMVVHFAACCVDRLRKEDEFFRLLAEGCPLAGDVILQLLSSKDGNGV